MGNYYKLVMNGWDLELIEVKNTMFQDAQKIILDTKKQFVSFDNHPFLMLINMAKIKDYQICSIEFYEQKIKRVQHQILDMLERKEYSMLIELLYNIKPDIYNVEFYDENTEKHTIYADGTLYSENIEKLMKIIPELSGKRKTEGNNVCFV